MSAVGYSFKRESGYNAEPHMSTVVILPTYNEIDNLRMITEAVLALATPNLSVLVVDDNSPDGTGDLADRLAAEHPTRVRVLHRLTKGLGRAYVAGFKQALDAGAQVVVQMDADFSHSPDYVPEMLDKLADYDVVVGSRYVAGGSIDERWEWGRYMLSRFANLYTRAILRSQIHDMTAGFKAWRRETLVGMGLERVGSNGYIFQVEMAYLAQRLGYRVLEIPIHFEDRRIGQSKMGIPIKIEAAIRTWQVGFRHHKLKPKDRISLLET